MFEWLAAIGTEADGQSYRQAPQPLFLSCTSRLASLNPSHSVTEPEESLEIMRSSLSSITQMGKTEALSKDMAQPQLREKGLLEMQGSHN